MFAHVYERISKYIHIYIYILIGPGVPWYPGMLTRSLRIAIRCLRELTRAEGPKANTKNSLRALTRPAFYNFK